MAEKIVEEYALGKINVTITELSDPNKVRIYATDGEKQMDFEARRYDYENYNRLMNQKIKQRFQEAG